MANDRADLRSRIMKEFGLWLRPYHVLVNSPTPPSLHEYVLAYGKNKPDSGSLSKQVERYLQLGSNINMAVYRMRADQMPDLFWVSLMKGPLKEAEETGDLRKLQASFAVRLERFERDFERLLDVVPLNWEPEIIAAETPYRAYLRIKSVLENAKHRIHYFDRYLSKQFFTLYLPDVGRDVEVRLVTTAKGVGRVSDVSKLAFQEFGNYQLIEVDRNQMHDRNLRVDNQIFSLGTGVSGAGVAPTNFTPSESSKSAHDLFDNLIVAGTLIHTG